MSLNKIKEFIDTYNNFAIIGHVNPDGDCIGSCMGLWYALKKYGKNAKVMINADDVPFNMQFLWDNKCTSGEKIDAYISVDCADVSRLCALGEEFVLSNKTACLDHHFTNSGFAKVNAVIADAAAAGEVIYDFAVNYLKISYDKDFATYIYTAIISDTGGFKYSNVTSKTLKAVGELIDTGIDTAYLYRRIFDTYKKSQLEIIGDVVSTLSMHFGGKVAVVKVTEKMLKNHGATFDDVDYLVSLPRVIDGVEVGVFLKDKGETTKVSLRSNDYVDVSAIASSLGGGGHKRAAGITIDGDIEKAKEIVLSLIEKVI